MRRGLTATTAALLFITGLTACEPSSYNFFDAVEGGLDKSGIGGARSSFDCTNIIPGIDFRDDMTCAHNDIRDAPPSPEPIPDPPLDGLDWSTELARFAESHAENCVYAHSDEADRPQELGRPAGESIYAASADSSTDRYVVEYWAQGADHYSYATNTCTGPLCEEYKQIVWSDTDEVGCAKATCDPLVGRESLGRADFWVCDYLPAGNVPGVWPYTSQQ